MRSHSQLTDGELGEAHQAADMLIREKYRPYLPSAANDPSGFTALAETAKKANGAAA